MKTLTIVVLLAAAAGVGLVEWRRRWLRRADRVLDVQIARNRFRTCPGMERMDESLRDRSARRRREREQALDQAKREIDRPRLHRVS